MSLLTVAHQVFPELFKAPNGLQDVLTSWSTDPTGRAIPDPNDPLKGLPKIGAFAMGRQSGKTACAASILLQEILEGEYPLTPQKVSREQSPPVKYVLYHTLDLTACHSMWNTIQPFLPRDRPSRHKQDQEGNLVVLTAPDGPVTLLRLSCKQTAALDVRIHYQGVPHTAKLVVIDEADLNTHQWITLTQDLKQSPRTRLFWASTPRSNSHVFSSLWWGRNGIRSRLAVPLRSSTRLRNALTRLVGNGRSQNVKTSLYGLGMGQTTISGKSRDCLETVLQV